MLAVRDFILKQIIMSKAEDYLFHTWIDGKTVIKTEEGDITILEILEDYTTHLIQ